MTRRPIGPLLMTLMLTFPGGVRADEDDVHADARTCGTLALYQLLRLEGRAADLDQVAADLPRLGNQGLSVLDLRETARRFGLPLDAVVLPKRQSAIHGPVLAYVKGEREGHFLIVRPVGHTGRLLQLIDGERTPTVIDADWLFGSPAWTGIALVPRRRSPLVMVGFGLSGICAIGLVLRIRARWRESLAAGPSL